MMEHIGEIAGVLSGASLSMGVGKDMLSRGLGQVSDTLKGIEQLHQREFGLHGHLKSPQFFASRQALYQQLNAQLRSAFLGKYLNLGGHESLRKGLGFRPGASCITGPRPGRRVRYRGMRRTWMKWRRWRSF
jgi:hypothetical protein